MQGVGFRVRGRGLVFSDECSRFRVQGLGVRMWGLGFGVEVLG